MVVLMYKKEKKQLKKEFADSEFGKNLNTRLRRLIIIGFLGLIFSLYLFSTY